MRVSAHFLIRRDGSLLQFVPCALRAWHAGASSWQGRERCNDFSIGVELEGTDLLAYADAQYAMLGRLTRALRRRYPIADLAGHDQVAPGRKTDPGAAFDWARYRRLAAVGVADGPAATARTPGQALIGSAGFPWLPARRRLLALWRSKV